MKRACILCGNVYENDKQPPYVTVREAACEICAKKKPRIWAGIGNWRSTIKTHDTLGK